MVENRGDNRPRAGAVAVPAPTALTTPGNGRKRARGKTCADRCGTALVTALARAQPMSPCQADSCPFGKVRRQGAEESVTLGTEGGVGLHAAANEHVVV